MATSVSIEGVIGFDARSLVAFRCHAGGTFCSRFRDFAGRDPTGAGA
jgi:hypothetical protein